MLSLNSAQQEIVYLPLDHKIFLEGNATTGKTAVGAARLRYLIEKGVPPESILVLTPQRTLAGPYYEVIQDPSLPPGGSINIMTLGGLAQRLINLFWPVIASDAGFKDIEKPPAFLTLESAQYYLASIVTPLMDEGYFESINVDRNRILSQIIDNLNKAALTGIPLDSIADRLKSAWVGQASNQIIYDQSQDCAIRFREYCLENNLLDYSLQVDIFYRFLLPSSLIKTYLLSRIKHLIVDNIEEDTPVTHESIAALLPGLESALLIYDLDGGYRTFLGADPASAMELKGLCDTHCELTQSFVTSSDLVRFSQVLYQSINHGLSEHIPAGEIINAYQLLNFRYYPEMIEGVARQITELIQQGVPPAEIAVLSPFLSDSLRFSLVNRLKKLGVPSRTHRPSRSLREEPAVQCLLNWAKLAHPDWKFTLSASDIRFTLLQSIADIDMVRADLLAGITYREAHLADGLSSFELIRPDMQERITHTFGQAFESLRTWLNDYKSGPPLELDVFFSRIFGELLSQPGFGFYNHYESAASAALLIESTQKFRRDTNNLILKEEALGRAYIRLVEEGLVAAQYLQSWQPSEENAVFISPAYTFIMANRPVSYQFWLDTGSLGWWERLLQPLTHPYVLSRHWPEGTPWTDTHEFSANQENLSRLVSGLITRCRERVYLVTTTNNEQGDEQKGPLLQAVQVMLRHTREDSDV